MPNGFNGSAGANRMREEAPNPILPRSIDEALLRQGSISIDATGQASNTQATAPWKSIEWPRSVAAAGS